MKSEMSPNASLKQLVKRLIPAPLLRYRQRKILAQIHTEFATKSVKEAFSDIYEKNLWGGEKGEFCSGLGSAEIYADEYVSRINAFVDQHSITSLVDLGCGDFQIGQRLARPNLQYTGVDIVDSLIDANTRRFGNASIHFKSLNIIEDPLPPGELCLIRQVLQHLSNAEIQSVLANLKRQGYRYVIITEHHPDEPVQVYNLDKPHGPDIRLTGNSGVYLDKPPFNQEIETLFEMRDEEMGGVIRTFLLKRIH